MSLLKLSKEITAIARNAGEAILEIYNSSQDVQVEQKSDDSPLTIADKASNNVIMKGLQSLTVQYPIISEENKLVPYEVRKDYDYYWLVDPLDGTKEFIKRNGDFTVNIALIHNGMPVIGVVYAPCLDEMYYAAKGEGAYLESNGVTKQINVKTFSKKDGGLNIVASRSHMNAETETFIAQFESPNLVSKGSSLKFLLVANGDAHLYPRVAPTMEWDTAAAQMVAEEAGGKVLQFGTTEPLCYNKENLLNPYFVTYGNMID